MARFSTASSRVVTRPARFRVEVNGVARPELEVERIARRAGPLPSECMLSVPQALAGSLGTAFDDALVVVWGTDERSPSNAPVFRGFVQAQDQDEGEQRSRVSVVARSVADLLDRVYFGQVSRHAEIYLPKTDPVTGGPSGWTLLTVVEWIFSAGLSLDSFWRGEVRLGDTSVLGAAQVDPSTVMPDLRFSANSVLMALRRVMALAPDIGWVERFTADGTVLDFFRYGDGSRGVRRIEAPREGRGPEEGAFVTEHAAVRDSKGMISRVIGYTGPTEYQVTFGTDHATVPLVPAWANASAVSSWVTFDSLTEAEKGVLRSPETGVPRSSTFVAGRERIFRYYRLPVEIVGLYGHSASNVFEHAAGQAIPVQVFRKRTILTAGASTGELVGTVATESFASLDGAQIDWGNGLLILPVAAVDVVRTLQGQTHRLPMHVYLTVTLRGDRTPRRGYDTGARGNSKHPGLSGSGMAWSFTLQTARYQQIGAELVGWSGATHVLGSRYFDPTAGIWRTTAGDAPVLVRDERLYVGWLSEQALKQRQARRTEARVKLPFIAGGYQPGDAVRLVGRGIDNRVLTIREVLLDYRLLDTMVVGSDHVPPRVMRTEFPGMDARGAEKQVNVGADVARVTERMRDQSTGGAKPVRVVGPGYNAAGDYWDEKPAEKPIGPMDESGFAPAQRQGRPGGSSGGGRLPLRSASEISTAARGDRYGDDIRMSDEAPPMAPQYPEGAPVDEMSRMLGYTPGG